VVVCTHNRPDDLARCLEALARAEDALDVIVVDSASDPPAADVVDRFRDHLDALQYLREPEPGLSRARNRGLALAAGPLVAFLDDDTVPASDWPARLVEPFSDETIACVGGACLPLYDCDPPRWLSPRLLRYAGISELDGVPHEPRSPAEWPMGANICFRRDDLVAVGGFSERLGRIGNKLLGGEEMAVVEALLERGRRVWLQADAVVHHRVHEERCRSGYYWSLLWWAGVTRARGRRSAALTLRLLAALPVRLVLWAVTRDRFHLYRTAESLGYVWACLRGEGGGRRLA
jgi:GT2 family glycosyltransferase